MSTRYLGKIAQYGLAALLLAGSAEGRADWREQGSKSFGHGDYDRKEERVVYCDEVGDDFDVMCNDSDPPSCYFSGGHGYIDPCVYRSRPEQLEPEPSNEVRNKWDPRPEREPCNPWEGCGQWEPMNGPDLEKSNRRGIHLYGSQ